MISTARQKPVLVTGATGYIGGRLVPRLIDEGYRVRCVVRDPRKLASRNWAGHRRVEIVAGDMADDDLAKALRGCGAAYYLVHSMVASGGEYAEQDRRLARNFARAAAEAGCDRILYLGGLGETGAGLSEHLESRREVEEVLAEGPVPVTTFRAAMIIGSGSASFEILRYLVERLPVMVTPRWVKTECQPIGVRNVMHYMVAALEEPRTTGQTLDIGGSDVMSYVEIMQCMAESLGLRRRIVIPVPVLTPRLSSLWIHLVTPLDHRIARPLAAGLKNRVVCRDNRAAELMPQELLDVSQAIGEALGKMEAGGVETSWSDAGPIPGDPDWAGGTVYIDRREREVRASPEMTHRAVCRIGGTHGWYAANILWRIRGRIDRLLGGPGLRRGRRSSRELGFGDAVDFWRVTGIEPGRMLKLRAEMKLPGEAELQFLIETEPGESKKCIMIQTARFQPSGLLGIAYWYAVMPFHGFVFKGMLQGIAESAEGLAEPKPTAPSTSS